MGDRNQPESVVPPKPLETNNLLGAIQGTSFIAATFSPLFALAK